MGEGGGLFLQRARKAWFFRTWVPASGRGSSGGSACPAAPTWPVSQVGGSLLSARVVGTCGSCGTSSTGTTMLMVGGLDGQPLSHECVRRVMPAPPSVLVFGMHTASGVKRGAPCQPVTLLHSSHIGAQGPPHRGYAASAQASSLLPMPLPIHCHASLPQG